MALDRIKDNNENKHHTAGENFKSRPKKDKTFQTKVVIRRLPPTMSEEQFLEQISPVPSHDYFYFVKGDLRLGQYSFSRAYLNFTQHEDIFLFKEKFDGYVFVDGKGNEYPALVEFAPFQKIPKKRSKKRDAKCGTIETDVDYLNFLESFKNPESVSLPTAEIYLEEIETREKELRANNGVPKITTPLIEYLKQRKIEQQKLREEKREERKRKELEKKRLREEERRRRKAEKERKEKLNSSSEKASTEEPEENIPVIEEGKSESVVQVLKNPEREKEIKENVPQKPKDFYSRHSRDKERNNKEWEMDRDRVRNKDRTKNERGNTVYDKERNRREKADYKSYSASKSTETEVKPTANKSNVESFHQEEDTSSKTVEEKEATQEQPPAAVEKSAAKTKHDSFPENVEMSVNNDQVDQIEEESSKEFPSIPETSNEHQTGANEECKSEGSLNDSKDISKDPRAERRIRNKDRPSLEIYRPGMRRFSTQRNSPQKEISTSTSNSSTPSPSPTPPLMTIGTKIVSKDLDKIKNRKLSVENSQE